MSELEGVIPFLSFESSHRATTSTTPPLLAWVVGCFVARLIAWLPGIEDEEGGFQIKGVGRAEFKEKRDELLSIRRRREREGGREGVSDLVGCWGQCTSA